MIGWVISAPAYTGWRSVGAKHVDGDVDASMEAVERCGWGARAKILTVDD